MRITMKKCLCLLMAALLFCGAFALTSFTAAAQDGENAAGGEGAPSTPDSAAPASLTVKATSNYFPESQNTYYDLSLFEDENGDAYVTVSYQLLADEMYLVNIDVGELTYDPAVLEWDAAYNQFGEGHSARLDFFPFAAENNCGTGVIHLTEPGRLVGNFSSVQQPAWAYNEDGTAVSVVKAVFKVLDRSAGETVVNCDVEYLALCEESEPSPHVQYRAVAASVVDETLELGETRSTVISPDGQLPLLIGDVNDDGAITVDDATLLQSYLAEFTDEFGDPLLNPGSANVLLRADANGNGRIDVRDVTEIQRFVAEIPCQWAGKVTAQRPEILVC